MADSAKDRPLQGDRFSKLVAEEMAIQRTNLPINGGLPSCVTLLDNFLLCFSIPNQFKSLYRYGGTRECGDKWEDFKFCMANRSLGEEQKTDEWIKRKAEFWAAKRIGPSSEDIWEAKMLDSMSGEKPVSPSAG